jgi:hypothetical protein
MVWQTLGASLAIGQNGVLRLHLSVFVVFFSQPQMPIVFSLWIEL